MIHRLGILVSTVILLIACNAFGQVDSVTVEKVSIINAKRKVDGIYKTFDEFRRNEPFYTDSFRVISSEFQFEDTIYPFDNLTIVVEEAYQDRLQYADKTESTRYGEFYQNSRFFGYCKNDTVYVAFWKFHPIVELGHLSLIVVKEYRFTKNTSAMGGGGTRSVEKYMVLDFTTGSLNALSTSDLLYKFEFIDPELWMEFKKAKRNRSIEVQTKYLKKFNEKHPITL